MRTIPSRRARAEAPASATISPTGTSPVTNHTGVSASTGLRTGTVGTAAGSTRRIPPSSSTIERVELGLALDEAHRGRGFVQPDDRLTGRRTVDPGRGEEGRHQGSGDERAPELLEHERGLGEAQSEPAVGLGHGEREHPGLAQLPPTPPVEGPGRLDLPHRVEREPAVENGANALLERFLIGRELEVHQRASLGRPSTRSPTMLRFTCDVPAAMVIDNA